MFTPTEAELAHARQVLAAGEAGVGVVDGQMIDDVHVRMARATLARAAPAEGTGPAQGTAPAQGPGPDPP